MKINRYRFMLGNIIFLLSIFFSQCCFATNCGRAIKADSEDPSGDRGDISKSMDIIKFIPGIGLIVPSLTYMSLVGQLNVSGEAKGAELAGEVAGLIGDVFNPGAEEGAASTALQIVFGSNLYCSQQKIYMEENQYISKLEAAPSGGYPMFPVYPMNIGINHNTGQCDLNPAINERFLSINDPGSGSNLNPARTKCTYSFSATSDQCLKDTNIPILAVHVAQVPVVEGICLVGQIKKAVAEMTEKIGNMAAEEAFEKAAKEALENAGENLEGLSEDQAKKLIKEQMDKMEKEVVDQIKKEAKEEAMKNVAEKNPDELSEATNKVYKKYKAKSTLQIIKDIANIGVLTGTELFLDAKFALDPVTMLAVMVNESALEIMGNIVMDLIGGDIACIIARLAAIQTVYYASLSIIAGVADAKYEKSKKAISEYTFCGHDWLSYKKTEDGKYWARGSYCQVSSDSDDYSSNCNSYYRTVINAVEKGNVPKNIKEEKFREYTYGGKEYDSGIPEYIISNKNLSIEYDKDYCIDPRTPEQKGFDSITQRYYMRGNDKANFACNRFFYDGESDCILIGKDLTEVEKRMSVKILEGYYRVSGSEYDDKCKKTFEKARECCEYRSKHLVCLEKKSGTLHEKGKYTFCFSHVFDKYQDIEDNLLNFLVNRENEKYGPTCEIDGIEFEAAKKIKTDYVCVYSYGLCPYDFKLNAGLNYRASYCDSNYFSNYSDGSDVLQRQATHFNKTTCEEGLFSEKMRNKYKDIFGNEPGRKVAAYTYEKVRKDMSDFNTGDFEIIYNFEAKDEEGKTINLLKKYNIDTNVRNCGIKISNNNEIKYNLENEDVFRLKSSAFGQVKNFCQYRAHCVEVEREQEYNDNYVTGSLFFDSSCSGKTSNSRNILQGDSGIIFRQFSAPIAECVFESLKNLINGVAGNSLCENGEPTNSNGYCGTDNEKTIKTQYENGNLAFFKNRYQEIDGKFIVKGYSLPESYNPFLKMQKYFINIIKAALALFLVVYFYKKLLLGDLENFTKPENLSKLVFTAFKFVIVIWLIFYNGWQDGVYNHLVNFATASYSFVSDIFVKSVKNPKNQILNLDENNIIRVSEKSFGGKNLPVLLCYRYDAFGNISYSRRDIELDGVIRRCEKGFNSLYVINTDLEKAAEIKIKRKNYKKQNIAEGLVISDNQEISQLIRFIEDYNKNNYSKLSIEIKIGDSWSDVEGSNLWNKNYDGCYFDSTEYAEGKNYLAPFDTLDCKLVRYIGYSTNNAAPSLILYSLIMLVPSFFFPDGVITKIINGVGGFIFGLMMTFMFVIFNIVIKTIYMFTSAFFTISVLIFISPIILPLMFFERTKNIFDTWLEYIMESIIKPVLNFSFLVVYVNLMDIILLKDTIFNKHAINGRGPNLICPKDSSSFICLINGIPGIQQIKALYNSGLFPVLIDVVIIFIFFKMSDQILEDVERIASSIFKSLSDPNKSSPSSFNITTKDGNGNIQGGVSSGIGTAMRVGNQIEAFRHDYINNAPGALFSKANEFVTRSDNKADKNDKDKDFTDKVIDSATLGLINKAGNVFKSKEDDGKLKEAGKATGNFLLRTGATIAAPVTGTITGAVSGVIDADKERKKLHLKFKEGDSKLKKALKIAGTPLVAGSAIVRGAAGIGKSIERLQNIRENIKLRSAISSNRFGKNFKTGAEDLWKRVSLKSFRDDSVAKWRLEENAKFHEIHKKLEEREKIKTEMKRKEEEYRILKKMDKGWKKTEEAKKMKLEIKDLKKKVRKMAKLKELGMLKFWAKMKDRRYSKNEEFIKRNANKKTFRKMDKMIRSARKTEDHKKLKNSVDMFDEMFEKSYSFLIKKTNRSLKDAKKILKKKGYNAVNDDSYIQNINFINSRADDDYILKIYDELSQSDSEESNIILEGLKDRTKKVRAKKVNKAIEENLEIIEKEFENSDLEENEENLKKIKEKLENNEKYKRNIDLIKRYANQNSVSKLLNDGQEEAEEDEGNPRSKIKLKDLKADEENIKEINKKSKISKKILAKNFKDDDEDETDDKDDETTPKKPAEIAFDEELMNINMPTPSEEETETTEREKVKTAVSALRNLGLSNSANIRESSFEVLMEDIENNNSDLKSLRTIVEKQRRREDTIQIDDESVNSILNYYNHGKNLPGKPEEETENIDIESFRKLDSERLKRIYEDYAAREENVLLDSTKHLEEAIAKQSSDVKNENKKALEQAIDNYINESSFGKELKEIETKLANVNAEIGQDNSGTALNNLIELINNDENKENEFVKDVRKNINKEDGEQISLDDLKNSDNLKLIVESYETNEIKEKDNDVEAEKNDLYLQKILLEKQKAAKEEEIESIKADLNDPEKIIDLIENKKTEIENDATPHLIVLKKQASAPEAPKTKVASIIDFDEELMNINMPVQEEP